MLEAIGDADIRVSAALCFVDSEWGLFSKPFHQGGVLVTWPKKLSEAIAEPGPLSSTMVMNVADRLAAVLPPSVPSRKVDEGIHTSLRDSSKCFRATRSDSHSEGSLGATREGQLQDAVAEPQVQIMLSRLLSATASASDRTVSTVQPGAWHVSLLTLANSLAVGL